MAQQQQKPFRILSIEGGGIRGIIPSLILMKLEQITGRHTTELFDLLAGTSTGGLIVAVLTMPKTVETSDPRVRWKFQAKDLLDVYLKEGPLVFEYSAWKKFVTINGIYGPMYDTKNRDERYKAWVDDVRLKDTLKDIVLTSYDRCKDEPIFFKSRKARQDPKHDYSMLDCVKAATAAPTVWPSHQVGDTLYMDALHGKNPSMFAVIEAHAHYPEARWNNMKVLSLGTGYTKRVLSPDKVITTGPASFVEVFNSFINGTTSSTAYMTKKVLEEPSKILYLEPELPAENMWFLDASPKNLSALMTITQDFIAAHEEELIEFAKELLDPSEWLPVKAEESEDTTPSIVPSVPIGTRENTENQTQEVSESSPC